MRGNRIIPTIVNLGMHKLCIADAKSSFGRRQMVVSSIHEPGRRPLRGPLSRFPLGDDKTRGRTMRESPWPNRQSWLPNKSPRWNLRVPVCCLQ